MGLCMCVVIGANGFRGKKEAEEEEEEEEGRGSRYSLYNKKEREGGLEKKVIIRK